MRELALPTKLLAASVANGVVYDSNMDQVAGGARKRQPFWFEQSAGGNYTAGATLGVPHED